MYNSCCTFVFETFFNQIGLRVYKSVSVCNMHVMYIGMLHNISASYELDLDKQGLNHLDAIGCWEKRKKKYC